MKNKFYITTPIYYVNDKPHIGHAYTTVAADVLARWHQQQGKDVFLLTGTDEHGAKIEQAAKKTNKSPQEFCDEKAQEFKNAWRLLNIGYNNFIRTTSKDHEAAVRQALQRLYDKGFIYKGEYKGLYCEACEQYKNPDDLIDGKCPDHLIEPVLMREESYFFKLAAFYSRGSASALGGFVGSGDNIRPFERQKEIINFIDNGLEDISISRKNIKWGIPLPFDKEFTTYVWVDAFLNYLTGIGWDGQNEKTLKYWPPDIQLMAKDILRVHATIWPALLLALDIDLPKKYFVHGFFTLNGQKMSKSLGNVIWPEQLVAKYGADASRYLLLSSTPFGQDGDISWEKMTEKYNADLANGLGNLISRVFNLIENNFDGQVKPVKGINLEISDEMREVKLFEALKQIKEKIDWANKYIDETKIWELVKNDRDKAAKVLSELLGVIIKTGECLQPFMPETAAKILIAARAKKIIKGEVLFPRIK